jgi:hypothetical protein
MRKSPLLCFYCHLPSTLLCDHVIGWAYRGEATDIRGGKRRIASSDYLHTCDMPLCTRHAENRGKIHFKMGRTGMWDTYDYCPEHPRENRERPRVLKDHEAATLRAAVRENARRRIEQERGTHYTPPITEQQELF